MLQYPLCTMFGLCISMMHTPVTATAYCGSITETLYHHCLSITAIILEL